MRTAVCISGQARFLENCFSLINENIIKPNNADIFMHVWSYENAPDEPYKFGGNGGWQSHRIEKDSHKKAIELYKPIDFIVENPFKVHFKSRALQLAFSNFKSSIPKEAEEAKMSLQEYSSKIFSDSFSMWYGIMQSNMLANLYSLKRGFEYDFVVRSRFDIEMKSHLQLKDFDKQNLYYCDIGQPQGLISDWLNFSSQKNMAIFSSVCMKMMHDDDLYVQNSSLQGIQYGNEFLSALNLHRHGITTIPIQADIGIPRL